MGAASRGGVMAGARVHASSCTASMSEFMI